VWDGSRDYVCITMRVDSVHVGSACGAHTVFAVQGTPVHFDVLHKLLLRMELWACD
jgi:hypothetical protein